MTKEKQFSFFIKGRKDEDSCGKVDAGERRVPGGLADHARHGGVY